MKKLLMSSLVLTVFSISMLLFQLSCKKDATAQTTPSGVTQRNIIAYTKNIRSGSITSNTFTSEIWLANIDGTNQRKIPISVPLARGVQDAKLTPDGNSIIFTASFTIPSGYSYLNIYSCSMDGNNVKKLVDGSYTDFYNSQAVNLDGVY